MNINFFFKPVPFQSPFITSRITEQHHVIVALQNQININSFLTPAPSLPAASSSTTSPASTTAPTPSHLAVAL